MKNIFFVSVLMTLTTIACSNTKQPNDRLLASWKTIQELIPALAHTYDNMQSDEITVEEFKKESSALLQAYSLFFQLLQKSHDFNPKYSELVRVVSSYNDSQLKSDMWEVYRKIDAFSTDWSNTFYEEQSLY